MHRFFARLSAPISSHTVAGFVLLGALLRLGALGGPSLDIDEGASLRVALLPFGTVGDMTSGTDGPVSLLQFLYRFDGHPPLFYATLHVWVGLVGIGSEWLLRLPFALCSVVALYAACRLAQRFLAPADARAAMALAAITQASVWCAQEIRMYPMLGMFVLCAAWFGMRAWVDGGRAPWVGWSVCSVLAAYTHYLGLFAIIAFVLFTFVTPSAAASRRTLVIAVGGVGLCLLAWFPVALHQTQAGNGPPALRGVGLGRLPSAVLQTGSDLVWGPSLPLPPAQVYATAICGVLALLLIALGARAASREASASLLTRGALLQITVPVLCLLAASMVLGRGLLQARFFLALAPFVALLLAPLGRTAPGRGALALVVAANVISLGFWTLDPASERLPLRPAAHRLQSVLQPDDLVLVEEAAAVQSMRYYLSPQVCPSLHPAHPRRIDDGSLAALVRGRRTVWLVLADPWVSDPDNRVARWLADRADIVEAPWTLPNRDPSHAVVVMRFAPRVSRSL